MFDRYVFVLSLQNNVTYYLNQLFKFYVIFMILIDRVIDRRVTEVVTKILIVKEYYIICMVMVSAVFVIYF
jgi:hypothetical protein